MARFEIVVRRSGPGGAPGARRVTLGPLGTALAAVLAVGVVLLGLVLGYIVAGLILAVVFVLLLVALVRGAFLSLRPRSRPNDRPPSW